MLIGHQWLPSDRKPNAPSPVCQSVWLKSNETQRDSLCEYEMSDCEVHLVLDASLIVDVTELTG